MNSRRVQYYGFEANGVEELHVDVRMRQKAGTQTTKIKSAKSFVEVHPRKFIPSKYTRYTVGLKPDLCQGRSGSAQLGARVGGLHLDSCLGHNKR